MFTEFFIQLIKKSTSSFVLSFPNVVLNAPCARFSFKPIAINTCDGSKEPDVHAEPADAHIPYASRFNSNCPASIPSNDILAFPGIFLLYLHSILYLVCFFLFELCNNLLNILIYYINTYIIFF